jgi:hypothetical protein
MPEETLGEDKAACKLRAAEMMHDEALFKDPVPFAFYRCRYYCYLV